jgi:putative flavoprotein involved in K+ transport
VAEYVDAVVIGGGQAGLAASYYLSEAEIPHVILDASTRVGDAWRARWDSLGLFSVARYDALPGLPFPGDQEHFPGKDEVADYLEAYARVFQLPVKPKHRVTALARIDGGYRLDTESGAYKSGHVIVGTGAYQRRHVPDFAQKLSDDVLQLHSVEYRNPDQLGTEQVLVVGAANSGAQIAEDLAPRHRVCCRVEGSYLGSRSACSAGPCTGGGTSSA